MFTRLAAARRRFGPATLASILVACGGGTTGPQPPAPPPPPPATPASLTVSAGDNQEGEPGKALTVAPSVVVRTAAGAGVPNVTVTFAVDSGGGTVGSATATTDASGIASAGSWTVGAAEGPQVLIASSGSLAPVKIRATSRIPTTTIATGTITTGGATITISQPGSPLDGVALTIQNGSVTSGAPITLAATSAAAVRLPPGVSATAPGLLITTTATLTKPAIVKFPAPAEAGKLRVVGVFDPTTGRIQILPPVTSDASSVTVMLPRLDASLATPPTDAASALRGFAAAAAVRADPSPAGLLLMGIDLTVLEPDFDSNFRVGVDNWDFDNLAVAWLPFLAGASEGDPAEEVIDPAGGMISTSLWYFLTRKATGAPPLHKRFRLQPDQLVSNRAGIRWAALANRGFGDGTARVLRTVEDLVTDDLGTFTTTQFMALKAMMYFSKQDSPTPKPVPLLLYDESVLADAELMAVGYGLATRTIGNTVEFVAPENEQRAYQAVVGPNGLTPLHVFNRAGVGFQVRSMSPLMLTPVLDNPAIVANWPKVVDGSVGDAEGWPTPELHWEKSKLDPTAVFVGDPLKFWWECATCTDFGNPFPGLPATASHPQAFRMGPITNGAMAPLPDNTVIVSSTWKTDSIGSDQDPTTTGHHILLPQPAVKDLGVPAGWLDWQTVRFRRVTLHPSPATVEPASDTTVTFTLAPSQPLPAGTTYSWVLRTANGRDSVATAAPTHVRTIPNGTDGTLVIMAHEAGTRRVIARDSVPVSAGESAYWRIDTFVDVDQFLDPDNDPGGPIAEMLQTLVTTPNAGLFGLVRKDGGASELVIRVKSSGVWTPALCCPPAGSDGQFFLGQMPEKTYTVGSFFTGWDATRWSQTTSDLTTGSITGQYVDPLLDWPVEGGSQKGPGHGVRLTATRNGQTLTGTITFATWFVGELSGVLDEGADLWQFDFTATRIGGTAAVKPVVRRK